MDAGIKIGDKVRCIKSVYEYEGPREGSVYTVYDMTTDTTDYMYICIDPKEGTRWGIKLFEKIHIKNMPSKE